MNAVAYYRYSSHSQTEQSIEGQKKAVENFAKEKGYIILREYIDRAKTGTDEKKRTEFQRLINDSKKRTFDFVLVFSLDRFGRNLKQSILSESKLQSNGVVLISATEDYKENSAGKLHRNIMMSFSQYYSDELSEKVTRGISLSVEQCKFIGGFLPLGFSVDENKRYIIDPVTAPVVKKIFSLYAAGNNIKKINDEITDEFGKSFFGNPSNSINRILDNPNYRGLYTRGKINGVQPVEGGMPRIISDELFERVQQMREKKKRSPTSTRNEAEYLLTTKLFCGYHSKEQEKRVMMVGVSGTGKSGKKYNYYTCKDVWNKKGCKKKTVSKDYIEDVVLSESLKLLTPENIDRIAEICSAKSKQQNNTPIIAEIKRELKANAKAIDNLLKAIENGGENVDIISERITEKRKEKSTLEKALAKEQMYKSEVDEVEIKFFLTHLLKTADTSDIKWKRAIIAIFVNAIFLYDDMATIIFNAVDKPVSVDVELLGEVENIVKSMNGGCSNSEPHSPPFVANCTSLRPPSGGHPLRSVAPHLSKPTHFVGLGFESLGFDSNWFYEVKMIAGFHAQLVALHLPVDAPYAIFSFVVKTSTKKSFHLDKMWLLC